MRRLAELPVARVHGGHNAAFDGARLRDIALGYLAASAPAPGRASQPRTAGLPDRPPTR
jgi:hypothetical protein